MEFSVQLSHAYFFAKNTVIDNGFANEIDWQDGINFSEIDERTFMNEISWVILASGMSDHVIRKVFPKIKQIMHGFDAAEIICCDEKNIRKKAKAVFNHEGKINAILFVAQYIKLNSFEFLKHNILTNGVDFIQTLPYMGKATSFHLAKNIGLNVAKPDRHLLRIADGLGFHSPSEMCVIISDAIQEKPAVIDLVLWRYCTLDKDYITTLSSFIAGSYCSIRHNSSN